MTGAGMTVWNWIDFITGGLVGAAIFYLGWTLGQRSAYRDMTGRVLRAAVDDIRVYRASRGDDATQ